MEIISAVLGIWARKGDRRHLGCYIIIMVQMKDNEDITHDENNETREMFKSSFYRAFRPFECRMHVRRKRKKLKISIQFPVQVIWQI